MTGQELALRAAAYQLAQGHRARNLPDVARGREDIWVVLLAELKGRCPGFADQEYSDALDYGFRMATDKHAELHRAAYEVADEYRDGKLRDARSWDETRASLRAELQRRCPGFAVHEYDAALVDGFKASR